MFYKMHLYILGSILPKTGDESRSRTVCIATLEQNVLDSVNNEPTTNLQKLWTQYNVSKTIIH